MNAKTYMEKKILLKGLLVECPYDNPLPDCPGNVLRNLPMVQFCRVVNNLSDKHIDSLLAHHENCPNCIAHQNEQLEESA